MNFYNIAWITRMSNNFLLLNTWGLIENCLQGSLAWREAGAEAGAGTEETGAAQRERTCLTPAVWPWARAAQETPETPDGTCSRVQAWRQFCHDNSRRDWHGNIHDNVNVFGLGGIDLLRCCCGRASTETCYCQYIHTMLLWACKEYWNNPPQHTWSPHSRSIQVEGFWSALLLLQQTLPYMLSSDLIGYRYRREPISCAMW